MSSIGNYALALSRELANLDKQLVYTKSDGAYPKSTIETTDGWQYKSHLSGVYYGFSWMADQNMKAGVPAGASFLKTSPMKSGQVGFTFLSGGVRVYKGLGVTAGLGFENLGLVFDNDLPLSAGSGKVVPDSSYLNRGTRLSVNSLNIARFTLPIMIELKSKEKGKSAYIAAGIVGSVQAGSNQLLRYKENDHRYKSSIRGSFHTSTFNYALNVRAGYGHAGIFVNYQFNQIFTAGNPEVYPFTAGLCWNFRK
jgi:hypothetical protein